MSKRLNIDAQEAIYIGDSVYDLQCAKQAGAKFGLALGAKTRKGFEVADYIFQTPHEILSLVKEIAKLAISLKFITTISPAEAK